MQTFEIGDRVVWTSQSAGYTKTKRGDVVAVVPREVRPFVKEKDVTYLGFGIRTKHNIFHYGMSRLGGGYSRNHQSYLVVVKNQLYWPIVSKLKLDCTGGE